MSPRRARAVAAAVALAAAGMTSFAPPALAQGGAPADTTTPSVTLLYQNFPNPFPTPESRITCIWFDLASNATVSLTIHDVRGNVVRRLIPSATNPGFLRAGRYGRGAGAPDAPPPGACDPASSWDGRDGNGELAPRGVYLIRLRAGDTEAIKKALFRGP